MDMQQIDMVRNNARHFQFRVSGLPTTGLTGTIFFFTAKAEFDDPDSAAVIRLDTSAFHVDQNGSDTLDGLVTVTIPPTATAALPARTSILQYDCKMKESGGDPHTISRGTLIVYADATQRTS